MSEGPYSWTILETIRNRGLALLSIHVLVVGIAAYVILRALIVYLRRGTVSTHRFILLSFLPLVAASFGVYLCLFWIQAVYFATGLVDPGALPAGIASARLFLYSGWLCTVLSLLSVYAVSRIKIAR